MSQPDEQPEPLLVNNPNNDSINERLVINPSTVLNPSTLSEGDYHVDNHHPPQYEQEFMDVIQGPPPLSNKRKRKFTILQVSSGICLLVSLIMIFALPPLLHSVIIEQAKEQTILSSDNQKLWAHFPGQSETIILRNFTFFKMQNEDNFLFFGQKPRFKEVSGYKIQQLEDMLDIEYLQHGNKVKVRDWIWFKEWYESRSLDEKVTILNMGNLGYWSTLKSARPTLLLQQGLALLFTNLEDSVMTILLGQGIQQQFLQNSSVLYSSLLAPAGISKNNTDFMWNNPVYGMNNQQNLGLWAETAINCFQNPQELFTFSNDSILLKNYFALSDGQMKVLMTKIYSFVVNLRKLLLFNHYCEDVGENECTGRLLGVAQLAEGWATGNPPPVAGIIPNDTICDANTTCSGKYPQPNAYFKNVFNATSQQKQMLEIPQQKNINVSFSRQTVLNWFNYNNSIQPDLNYNTAENCLLHIGNLDTLWEWGQNYDKSHNKKWLVKISNRFGLNASKIEQAFVFWSWIKYFTQQFVLQRGNNQKLGVANIFTQGFYEQFAYLQDNLQPFLLANMLQEDLSGKKCEEVLKVSLDAEDNPDLVSTVCKHYKNISQLSFSTKMMQICEHKYGKQWTVLRQLGVSLLSLDNHCDITLPGTIGYLLYSYKLSLDQQYKCNLTPNPICSNYELAVQQWQDSNITKNPPERLKGKLNSSTTFHSWNTHAKAFEYEHFINKFSKEEHKKFPKYDLNEIVTKLTFQQWFSTNKNLERIVKNEFNEYFFKYMRYVCIFITLNGFSTTRTVRQFLFGYEDEFLAQIKNAYPPFGGDPSAPSLVNFNDLNVTAEQCNLQVIFGTGKDDFKKASQYLQINGYSYFVNNFSWFDGNRTRWAWLTPWAVNDYFYGTNGKLFGPDQFDADNLSLLIPNVQRYGSNFFHNQTDKTSRYGQQLYQSYLSGYIGEVSKENEKYYQTLPNVFNVSTIYGMPLYVTKNHFMNCTEWLQKVDIRIGNTSEFYTQISHWDDTFAIVEPYTGVSFQSNIYLQNNYYHQPDLLYQYNTKLFMPIFSINRSGNLTEERYHFYFDPLMAGLAVKEAIFIAGIVFAVFSAVVLSFSTYKKRKIIQYDKGDKDGSLIGGSMVKEPPKRKKAQVESLLEDEDN